MLSIAVQQHVFSLTDGTELVLLVCPEPVSAENREQSALPGNLFLELYMTSFSCHNPQPVTHKYISSITHGQEVSDVSIGVRIRIGIGIRIGIESFS